MEGYRVHGDCVFFPGPSRPTERLQHQPDTENPNVHPATTRPNKCEWKRGDQFNTEQPYSGPCCRVPVGKAELINRSQRSPGRRQFGVR